MSHWAPVAPTCGLPRRKDTGLTVGRTWPLWGAGCRPGRLRQWTRWVLGYSSDAATASPTPHPPVQLSSERSPKATGTPVCHSISGPALQSPLPGPCLPSQPTQHQHMAGRPTWRGLCHSLPRRCPSRKRSAAWSPPWSTGQLALRSAQASCIAHPSRPPGHTARVGRGHNPNCIPKLA